MDDRKQKMTHDAGPSGGLALRLTGIRETEIGDALGERMARLCGPEHIRRTQEVDDERFF